MNNLARNISYQSIYQVLTVITPLITAPYLSRVLGPNALGVFSYTSSIVAYFVLFAMLGTVNYGTKCIAEHSENRKKRSISFWSIFIFQILTCIILLAAYIVFIALFIEDNLRIAYLQAIGILACFFNINWLLYGVEDFAVITLRNTVIKIIEVSAILLFVNSKDDLDLYVFIMSGGTLFSNLVAFTLIKKYVDFVRIEWKNIYVHIRPNIVLFLPLLAVSVYHIMDKTMLGVLSTYQECGYYYNADKLVNIPLCILTGVGTVMLPRISNLISKEAHEDAVGLFGVALELIVAVGIALSFGIAAVSNEFVPFFFGNGFDKCVFLTYVFAPILVIKGITNTIRMLYLIPYDRNIEFLYSVLVGALVNIILNVLLIPKYASLGAVIGTLGAEFSACAFQVYKIHKDYNICVFFKETIKYTVIGIIMLIAIRFAAGLLGNTNIVLKIGVEVILGIVIYGLLMMLYWKNSRQGYFRYILTIVHKNKRGCYNE